MKLIPTSKAIAIARFWMPVTRVLPIVALLLLLLSLLIGIAGGPPVLRLVLLLTAMILFVFPIVAVFRNLKRIHQADQLIGEAIASSRSLPITDVNTLETAEAELVHTVKWWRVSYDMCFRTLAAMLWLRHRQMRHAECVDIAKLLIRHQHRKLPDTLQSAWFLLAKSSLELGDLTPVGPAIAQLRSGTHTLDVSLATDALETEFLVRTGLFGVLMTDLERRIELAMLMPRTDMLATLRCLAQAALASGARLQAQQLDRRVGLLSDETSAGSEVRPA